MLSLSRRSFLHSSSAFLGLKSWNRSAAVKSTLDPVIFTTSWHAQGEHGGFYQALATGLYQRYNLDVTIKMGGANLNTLQLLAAGVTDFVMGSSIGAIHALVAGLPVVVVAAIFQKDPQCLLAHPNQGIETLEDLKGHPIFVSIGSTLTYWPLLRSKYGFEDSQRRPYNGSLAPFFADLSSAQQGYVTAEPYLVKTAAGFEPITLPLSDYGYNPYDTTIEALQSLVQKKPDLVQRFVAASIEGWYSYLQDPTPGNQLIKQANPDMTDGFLAFTWEAMKRFEILTSGDAATLGIGAMTANRWQEQFQTMVDADIFKPTVPYQEAFTLEFVNKGWGLEQLAMTGV